MPKEIQTVNNYNTHLYKVMKQVHVDSNITKEALNEVNMLIHKVAEHIIASATSLAKGADKKTIMLTDIVSALEMVLLTSGSPLLLNHAKDQVNKSIETYNSSAKGTVSAKVSRTKQAGLILSVSRSENLLRHHSRMRVSAEASVALTAALEYLCAEIFELSGNECILAKRTRITNRCVALAIAKDAELSYVLGQIRLSGGTVKISRVMRSEGRMYGKL